MRTQLAKLNQALPAKHLRRVRAENLHVTLVFLGHVDSGSESLLREKTDDIRLPKFSLTFDQIECWKKPQILCLRSLDYDPVLLRLVDQLKNRVKELGIRTEEREYRPHVTLARKARHAVVLDIEPVVWQAHSFSLLQSCSTANGVQYRVLQSWDLY